MSGASLTEQAASLAIDGACRSLRLPTVRVQAGPLAEAAQQVHAREAGEMCSARRAAGLLTRRGVAVG